MNHRKILAWIIIIGSLFTFTYAQIVSNINLNMEQDKVDTLKSIGIGELEKQKLICDNNSENCYNETYTDKLVIQSISGNKFRLYEEGGINKEFKIKLEQICAKQGMCIDEEMIEEYECCLIWRDENEQEIMVKVQAEAEKILNKIIKVTEERQQRNNIKVFNDKEVII